MSATPSKGDHSVTVNGRVLHAHIDGAEKGRWLLLGHSIATNTGVWDAVMPALIKDYRVLNCDARGHGGSGAVDPASAEATSFDDLVADAIGLLDHFGIQQVDAIGVSMGGVVMLGLALTAPSRLRSVTAVGSRADMPEPAQKAWAERIAAVRGGGMEAIREATLNRWFTADFRAAQPATVARVGQMITTTSPGGFIAGAAALTKLNLLPRLDRVTVPALLVVGSNDQPTPDAMAGMAAKMPRARLEIVQGAGHLVPVDNAAATTSHIVKFLSEVH